MWHPLMQSLALLNHNPWPALMPSPHSPADLNVSVTPRS